MKIIIRYFGPVRELAGREEEEVTVREGTTVAELCEEVVRRYPSAETLIRSCRFAVDMCYAGVDTTVPPQAEVAIIPPVAGG